MIIFDIFVICQIVILTILHYLAGSSQSALAPEAEVGLPHKAAVAPYHMAEVVHTYLVAEVVHWYCLNFNK